MTDILDPTALLHALQLGASVSDIFDPTVLVNALTLGAIYALIAVGYTMVYGIIQLINFAHGEVFMVGTYVGLLLVSQANVWLAAAIVLAMVACLMLGAVLDFSAYLPLRRKHALPDRLSMAGLVTLCLLAIAYFEVAKRAELSGLGTALLVVVGAIPIALFVLAILGLMGKLGRPAGSVSSDRLSALITAIGMSLSIQTIVQLVLGADYRAFPETPFLKQLNESVTFLGFKVQGKEVLTWVAALVLMVGLNYLVARTRIGKAMRACAQDKDTAALMGVNVNWVISVTFMIGSALAAVAGILFAIKVGGNIYFRMGYYPGVIAFAAAVLGGIGSIRGAVAGGFIIGATQSAAQAAGLAAYDFAFAFGLMILVILFRPWGLFGRAEAKRA